LANSKSCYWCGAPATSKEHVPPRCFFPKEIIREGLLQKQNWNHLVTVPSCDEHNNQKSSGDEYLLAHIAILAPENLYAQAAIKGSVLRISKRRKDLLKLKRMDETGFYCECDDKTIGFEIEGIARALYFIRENHIFCGKCLVYFEKYSAASSLHFRNLEAVKAILSESKIWGTDVIGRYLSIFKYHFSPIDQLGCASLILTFYESIRVCVVMSDERNRSNPKHSIREAVMMGEAAGINPLPFLLGEQGYNDTETEDE
jgi:hypothetical protein